LIAKYTTSLSFRQGQLNHLFPAISPLTLSKVLRANSNQNQHDKAF
jgi:hypothetical protein